MASVSSSACQEQVGAAEIRLFLPFIFTLSGGGGGGRCYESKRGRFCALPQLLLSGAKVFVRALARQVAPLAALTALGAREVFAGRASARAPSPSRGNYTPAES